MKMPSYSDIKIKQIYIALGRCILAVCLILTAYSTYYVYKKNSAEDRLRFEFQSDRLISKVMDRMGAYEGALIQSRAYLLNSPDGTVLNLKQYFKDTEIFKSFPGLQGLGYAMKIDPIEVYDIQRRMRLEYPDFKIWPKTQEKIKTTILVIEPMTNKNRKALGYDMYTDEVRRKAMDRALELDRPVVSSVVQLVQDEGGKPSPGFLMYLPHLSRKKKLLGFVYSPFRARKLFKSVIKDDFNQLNLKAYFKTPSGKDFLFELEHSDNKSGLRYQRKIPFYDQELILDFAPSDKFQFQHSLFIVFGVACIGTIISLFLYWIYIFTHKQLITMSIIAEERENLLRKEKEHVQVRDDFLSIASHELKTPLTSLKLQAQVMLRSMRRGDKNVFSEEKVTNLIHMIDTQTTRLTRLVDDMLDISRIRTGRLKMVKEKFFVSEAIYGVIKRLEPQIGASQTPEVQIEKDIEVFWDKFRIEQVLTNLMTNALRYGDKKPFFITAKEVSGKVLISVKDQGMGISSENLSKIFNRFERAGMSASEVSGLGLGLYITKQIVENHGGTIEVDSEIGKGSDFKILIPPKIEEELKRL